MNTLPLPHLASLISALGQRVSLLMLANSLLSTPKKERPEGKEEGEGGKEGEKQNYRKSNKEEGPVRPKLQDSFVLPSPFNVGIERG